MNNSNSKIININIIDIFRLIKQDKFTIVKYMIICAIIGLVIAFTTPKIYKSSVMLAPEESGAGFTGSISSLAAMVGMNMKLGQTGDAIYPEIYPDLVGSNDFILDLLDTHVTTSKGDFSGTYTNYLLDYCKPAMIDYPKIWISEIIKKLKNNSSNNPSGAINGGSILFITQEQFELIKGINSSVNCDVDKKTSVITITVTEQDPLVAALIADSARVQLQHAITNYRTQKAQDDIKYLSGILENALNDYLIASSEYSQYADAHTEVLLKSFSIEEEKLEKEMQLKYDIYQQIEQQLQLANAKLLEKTPAFTIVQSATVPTKHSSRPKIVTLIIWMSIGFFIRFGILAWKNRYTFINL